MQLPKPRCQIPELGLSVHNDTPLWYRPRRTIWFLHRNGIEIRNNRGNLITFSSFERASSYMEKLAKRKDNGQ